MTSDRTEALLEKLVLIGGGEHARVVLEAARLQGIWSIVGFIDPRPRALLTAHGLAWLGDDTAAAGRLGGARVIITLGGARAAAARRDLAARYAGMGSRWATVVHPSSVIAQDADLGEGTVVLAGAVLNSGARVGSQGIINTGAIVEHDVALGTNVQVGPGSVIGGGTTVGDDAFIGLGARIRDHIQVGAGAVIAMGAVVIDDVAAGAVVAGIPARPMRANAARS